MMAARKADRAPTHVINCNMVPSIKYTGYNLATRCMTPATTTVSRTDQCRYRGWAFHGIGQPDVQREHGRLARPTNKHQRQWPNLIWIRLRKWYR